ncbi:hypothetical protein BAU06_17345 [Bordetella bronchialis]|uniref:ABC transmembrane type-1 domain-containing protein n=1 Tax=Bordetella bronchialis TaxID=463025 RepID=A0ABN4R8N6_9BORD|nr:hypothetical protein BAU06_17345 [Bordetella bronchialis]
MAMRLVPAVLVGIPVGVSMIAVVTVLVVVLMIVRMSVMEVFVPVVMLAMMGMPVAVIVTVTVAVIVSMTVVMIVPVLVRMIMVVSMIVLMPMPMPLAIRLLRQCVVFREGFVMAMLVPAAVGAGLRLEGGLDLDHLQPQPQEQIAQYGILFQLEVVGTDFHGCMAVAQVIGGPQQDVRVDAGGPQDGLRRGDHAHQAAVFGDQCVAIAQHGAARQEQGDFLAAIERGGQAAAAARFEGQGQGGRAPQQRLGDSLAAADHFFYASHANLNVGCAGVQNRK